MSRWVLRAAIFFCVLALLSAAALLLFELEVTEKSVVVSLLWMTTGAFLIFATLISIGVWRKGRKERAAAKR